MVVFTCNHCGESLQKPKVEKHYFTVCRRAKKSLTCVDCLKDFLDEEYVAHTKCITEEERYAAKGSFSNGVVKKGEVKQESWTEVIQSVIEKTTDAKPAQQQILTLLSNSANVPRKKNKFMNFVKNAMSRKISDQAIGEVWDIIEKYKGQQAETPTTNETTPEMGKENLKIENGNQENIPADESTIESSKKKKKSKKLEVTKNIEENKGVAVESTIESSKKKKKSKKLEVTKNIEENKGVAVDDTVEELSKQEKSGKVEKNTQNELNGTPENEVTVNETSVGSLEKKKKKAKNIEKNGTGEDKDKLNVEVAIDATAIETSNKKKKPNVIQENNDATITKILDNEKTANNDVTVETSNKKKKPKVIQENNDVTITKIVDNEKTANNDVTVESSKKKKRKSKNSNEDVIVENGNSTSNIEVDMEPSKKKKKKSECSTESDLALEHQFSQQTEMQNGEESAVNGAAENGKAKKRKLKNSGDEDCKESEKEKKKKNEIANNEEAVSNQTDEQQQNSNASSNNFLYKEKILEVLQAKKNISMEKLQKKILDAYQKATRTEPSKNVIKKFNKHLRKVSGIEIYENNVRLINS